MKILGYMLLIPIVLALIVAIIAGSILWSGFVLATLWAWFVIPLGAPALGVLHAAGIAMVIRFMTFQGNVKEFMDSDDMSSDEKMKLAGARAGMGFAYPLVALFFGWIIHKCM